MRARPSFQTATLLSLVILAGCGGGGSASSVSPPPPPPTSPDEAARAAAATSTANNNAECAASKLGPFYWEIGDVNGLKVSGQVGSSPPSASTVMSIASASKWVYSSYVLQKLGARPQDVEFLNFTSGYNQFLVPLCSVTDTVASCLDGKDGIVAGTVGKFFYGSGHMQKHAVATMGLGNMGNAELTNEITGPTGVGVADFLYTQPQLAGGLVSNATAYAQFLRRILSGALVMKSSLGASKVCTNTTSTACGTSLGAPVPDTENWNYSLGHWVEDDPTFGDGAFSSPGALGFYPWIDSSKTYYGVMARRSDDVQGNQGYLSARCGRLIRKAWMTATAQ